ncbi:hypothetical protein ACFQY4_14995 [Catellatospora bangladeshensis]|uniref:Uncharacterized protein n=1 Tax=Catellatospora bangladeshensis TaxID=310355 RepID=A0A8J3NKJ8_9ACTN|nr:hypothetical protein [Catellatospora bangladeshensis]GIF83083.1 hypothetical protein Cba03nite_44320 [Catellatospora bangladeshensis]
MDSDIVTAEQDLARLVAAQVAPEEDELFTVLDAAYRKDPARLTAGGSGDDEMLGFGVETMAALMTPVVLAVVTEVMRYLTEQYGTSLRSRLSLRRARRDAAATEPATPAIDDAQLAHVRSIVLDKCTQAGIDEGRSRLLADSVAGALRNGG